MQELGIEYQGSGRHNWFISLVKKNH
jgi:hypothetical protein